MNTDEVGRKLVELCRQGKNLEAIDTLFAADAVSEEAMDSPDFPRVTRGRDAIRKKNEKWFSGNDVHGQEVRGPLANGDEFAVIFVLDFTPKSGNFTGKRMTMEEVGVYTVKAGAVVRERFFYSLG
jgi:ketosteroid isomerase-like protein